MTQRTPVSGTTVDEPLGLTYREVSKRDEVIGACAYNAGLRRAAKLVRDFVPVTSGDLDELLLAIKAVEVPEP